MQEKQAAPNKCLIQKFKPYLSYWNADKLMHKVREL